jgi:hypothetical protein
LNRQTISQLIGFAIITIFSSSLAIAQVFPPRQPQPPLTPPTQPGQMPGQPAMPQQFGGPQGAVSKIIPFIAILGDPTKSFIQLGNMRSPFDTNFSLGRGLAGRIALEKYTYEAGNGEKSYIHITGGSNPPIVTTEGAEVRLQFVFPVIQFKTYYKDYTGEGDSALSDLVAEKVLVDVFILPTLNERRFPTFHSIRIAMTGAVKEADKCTRFFNIVFPVNICKAAAEYFKEIQPALENGIRDVLLQPQTRVQFEQQMFQFVRTELLAKSGINPMSPAQVEIIQSEFRGTNYLVTYLIR